MNDFFGLLSHTLSYRKSSLLIILNRAVDADRALGFRPLLRGSETFPILVQKCSALDRKCTRQRAEMRFSSAQMASNSAEVYARIAAGASTPSALL